MPRSRFFRGSLSLLIAAIVPALAGPASADMRTFDTLAYRRALLEKRIVVLDFHAKNCKLCRSQSPVLEKVLSEPRYEDVVGFLMDYKASVAVRKKYDVQGEMTVLFLYGGREMERVAGEISHESLKGAIETAITKVREELKGAAH